MQGINAKEHQNFLDAYKKFEKLLEAVENKLPEEENKRTKEGIEELRHLYFKFHSLLNDLSNCTQYYEKRKKIVQSVMFKSIRKMKSELRNKGENINYL